MGHSKPGTALVRHNLCSMPDARHTGAGMQGAGQQGARGQGGTWGQGGRGLGCLGDVMVNKTVASALMASTQTPRQAAK